MNLKFVAGFLLVGLCPFGATLRGAATNDSPEFKEVYELLRANLAGANEAELNRAAVQGLLSQLRSQAALLGESKDQIRAAPLEPGVRTAVFDGSYGYLRVSQIGVEADKQISAAYQELASSNRVKGLVLDLRFADGHDYAAAAALADWFFPGEKPMIDYGDGLKKSTVKTNALSLPLAVLVNRQTTGAAEAFAGILRQARIGLLLGTNTAGKATMGKEFPLTTGQRLWIAGSLVKLGDGQVFPAGGLQPDILVEVNPEDEQAYFDDAYKLLPKAGNFAASSNSQANLLLTNRPMGHRITEAELVQRHRDGQLPDPDVPSPKPREKEAPAHVIYDPALARAIDLLKGLAVVQHFRPS